MSALQSLPKRKVLQRVIKMCSDCAKQSDANQMTSKNLAIVFTPVLFHDEAEPLNKLAMSQGHKMTAVELMISNYGLVFAQPLEPVYKPPPQPGEVPLLTERDWALLTAKAELKKLDVGDVLLERGQPMQYVYRVQRGVVLKETSQGKRRLISGDFFGERALLGRAKSDARYVAEEEAELWQLSPSHLSAIWNTDGRANTAFWGHVALSFALELRGQTLVSEESIAASRMTVAGLRFSTVLQEEFVAMSEAERQAEESKAAVVTIPFPVAAGAVIVERECMIKKHEGCVFVTALEVRFEGVSRLGRGAKTVSFPYESFERISTSVSDDVVRGKRLASKKFSKHGPFHTVTLAARKRKNKSVKRVQKVLQFFCESDAAEVFACAGKLFNTISEDLLAEQKRFRKSVPEADEGEGEDPSATTKVVSKAVALFDFNDNNGFEFRTGDLVLLTTEKKDLRVRGRLAHGGSSSHFALLPRDYVEPIVWVSNVKGLPSDADVASIFSGGSRITVEADHPIVKEGAALESLFLIESGVCRTVSSKASMPLGKMAKGDIFGEVSFLLGGTATCSVIAHGMPVVVVEVRKEVMRPVFAARPDLAAKFYRLFAATDLRRIERNATLPFAERQRKSSIFSTSKQELLVAGGGDKLRKSVMLNALI